MRRTPPLPVIAATLAIVLALRPAAAQTAAVAEAAPTVAATFVEPSATRPLRPGERVSRLYERNYTEPYVLQRLTDRTYWFQHHYYATVFYVGDRGVLLFDPLEGAGDALLRAIAQVTPLPVTAIVYAHGHADHIADAPTFVEAAARRGVPLRVIASANTAEKMRHLGSGLPAPTETVAWPRGAFRFEGLAVEMHGLERGAHADDHAVWLLGDQRVAHIPDLVDPNQLPFWGFDVSENFVYYEANARTLLGLPWTFLSAGHGNVGYAADVEANLSFIADLKAAVGAALREIRWGDGIDPTRYNAHTVYLTSYLAAVSERVTEALRAKYGRHYGYDVATPRNAEMVAIDMVRYR